MRKKYYVISDIHSHYSSMICALRKHGYDSSNIYHHLIVLGDLFDRGNQTREVLDYLYNLSIQKKASLILGNHDSFLLDVLSGDFQKYDFNIQYNGFGKTLEQLSGLNPLQNDPKDIRDSIMDKYPYLFEWLQNLPYYIEVDDYIFVHGGIDGSKLDWKTMSSRHDFVWSREINLPKVEGKIVVAGHHRVATIRKKSSDYHLLFLHNPEMFDILYEDGKILIDRYVEVSNEINVLVIDKTA